MDNRVELHEAFIWDCDECGRENLLRAIPSTPPPAEEIRKMMNLEPYDDVPESPDDGWVFIPPNVTCTHCESAFESVPPWLQAEEQEEEEEDNDFEDPY